MHPIGGKLIHNRWHVALCSAVAAWTWAQVTGYSPAGTDLLVIPLVMLCIYQWNRTFDAKEDAANTTSRSGLSIRQMIMVRWLCMGGFVLGIALSWQSAGNAAVFILMTVVLLGLLYSTPLAGSAGRRLKNIFVVKNLTSALGWTLLVVAYPVVHAGEPFSLTHGMAAWVMFSSVWMVELIWDIRDRRGDAIAGVRTVPVLLGTNTALGWVHAVNTTSAIVLIAALAAGLLPVIWAIVLANNILVGYWSRKFRDATTTPPATDARIRSHQLVGIQTILLFGLGMAAMVLA
jgi:4-hydroxybenzoate polyprenyltransferase